MSGSKELSYSGISYGEAWSESAEFQLVSPFTPSDDQRKAVDELVSRIEEGQQNLVLLGVTGSGKTFTMAKVIERLNRPTLVLSHNKTLAAQLYQEFRNFFQHNAVEYFVSYYDLHTGQRHLH